MHHTLGGRYWQVGKSSKWDGTTTTNIWRDQWFPGGVGLKHLCCREGATAERVNELLSPDGLAWDDEALDRNLLPLDAEMAKRIPIGHSTDDT